MNLKCEGSCEEHIGQVVLVHVSSWGQFAYCEAAIAEDSRRGLTVTPVEDDLDNVPMPIVAPPANPVSQIGGD